MPISWNEIRQNAIRFSREWAGAKREIAEKQPFWNEFFEVFGIRRRTVAAFEEPVKRISGDYGYIDLFWCGMLLVEHKSLHRFLVGLDDQFRDNLRIGRGNELRTVFLQAFAQLRGVDEIAVVRQRD